MIIFLNRNLARYPSIQFSLQLFFSWQVHSCKSINLYKSCYNLEQDILILTKISTKNLYRLIFRGYILSCYYCISYGQDIDAGFLDLRMRKFFAQSTLSLVFLKITSVRRLQNLSWVMGIRQIFWNCSTGSKSTMGVLWKKSQMVFLKRISFQSGFGGSLNTLARVGFLKLREMLLFGEGLEGVVLVEFHEISLCINMFHWEITLKIVYNSMVYLFLQVFRAFSLY